MSEEAAQGLVGAQLCLHERKAAPSQLGGRIVEVKMDQPRGKGATRSGVDFVYVFDSEAKNVVADLEQWKRQDWYIDEND